MLKQFRWPLYLSLALASQVIGCAVASANTTKSISGFVSCNGTSDDTDGTGKAFAAAKNGAFTLVVDCPVRLHSGLAIDRGIFIDNGTTVEFTGNGKFIVDNIFHPAFVIANSTHITLTNWNVEWDGVLPIDGSTGGYELGGKFVGTPSGRTQPAGAFNDLVLTKWLATNRAVTFDATQGWAKAIWVGGVNPAGVFFITGDSSDIVFKGLRLYSSPSAGGDHFIPLTVSFSPNWKSNQTVNGKTPAHSPQFVAVPHKLTFSDVTFDGTLMGFQGNVRDVTFDNIKSHRYGDLQDANNANSGGMGKWYPPPHLFYLNYTFDGDPALFNSGIHITNVVDDGPRVGVARDKGGSDTMSGYAQSLKLGCSDCSVDNYSTNRPDGFMDVLQSNGLTVTNVRATYDSSFLNDVFQGLRFPMAGYRHVTFENVVLTDTSASTKKIPVSNATNATNDTIVFKNFQVIMNSWDAGTDLPMPSFAGTNNDINIQYTIKAQKVKAMYLAQGEAIVVLKVTPYIVAPNQMTSLTWSTRGPASCMTGGGWSGPLVGNGSKEVKIGPSGDYDFTVNCLGGPAKPKLAIATAGGGAERAVAGLRVVAQ